MPRTVHVVDYAAMRQEVIEEGVIYIPPHCVGLLNPCFAAGVKFLTPRDSYAWLWRLENMVDTQKDKQIAIAERMRIRLLGRFGWFWRMWFRILVKFRHFTWWLYRNAV